MKVVKTQKVSAIGEKSVTQSTPMKPIHSGSCGKDTNHKNGDQAETTVCYCFGHWYFNNGEMPHTFKHASFLQWPLL